MAMPTNGEGGRSSGVSWKTLGGLWIAYGIARLVVAVVLVMYSGVATVMFGALLTRVADYIPLMALFHFFYVVGIIVAVLSGIFGVLAGLTLLAGRGAGRTLAIVASLLSVSDLPLGTTLGIYTLIVFLR